MSSLNLMSKETAQRVVLPLEVAVYHAVRDVRGGVGAVAGAYGFNANTLQLKTNPNTQSHHVNLRELEVILGYTRDPRLMDSLCAVFGDAAWMDLSAIQGAGDQQMILQLGELSKRVGDMTQSVAAALADGRVEPGELAVLEKCAQELHSTVHGIIARAHQMMQGGHNGLR